MTKASGREPDTRSNGSGTTLLVATCAGLLAAVGVIGLGQPGTSTDTAASPAPAHQPKARPGPGRPPRGPAAVPALRRVAAIAPLPASRPRTSVATGADASPGTPGTDASGVASGTTTSAVAIGPHAPIVAAEVPDTAPDEADHGCPVPDPSGSGGCITPAMGQLMAEVIGAFGDLPVSCWDPRDGDPYSDHPKGRACDYTFGRIGSYPGPADVARGWGLALWLRVNAVALHVNYVIWQGRIWSRAHDAEGWRPYTGGGHYSTAGPTNGHYDHVHVSTVD
ncbi:MAG TPA: hypothetical protein VI248_15925 [Kineosporiaceae bacterium]